MLIKSVVGTVKPTCFSANSANAGEILSHQLTNKQVHCASDKDCMERECPRRVNRLPARFCQSPTLPGPPSTQLRSNVLSSLTSERQSSGLDNLPDYSGCSSTDECTSNNSALSSDIR